MALRLKPADSDRRSVRRHPSGMSTLRRARSRRGSQVSVMSLEPTFLKKIATEHRLRGVGVDKAYLSEDKLRSLDKGSSPGPMAVASTSASLKPFMVDLRDLTPHFEEIKTQVIDLESLCKENEEKIDDLETETSELNSLLESVRQELDGTREEAEALEMDSSRLRGALELRDSQLAESRLRERESRLLFAQQRDDATEEQKLLAAASGRLADVSTECEDLRNERDNLLLEKETSARELQLLREKLTKTHALQQKNRTVLSERDELRKQLSDLESDSEDLIVQLQEADTAIDALEEELDSLRTAARLIERQGAAQSSAATHSGMETVVFAPGGGTRHNSWDTPVFAARDHVFARTDTLMMHLDTQLPPGTRSPTPMRDEEEEVDLEIIDFEAESKHREEDSEKVPAMKPLDIPTLLAAAALKSSQSDLAAFGGVSGEQMQELRQLLDAIGDAVQGLDEKVESVEAKVDEIHFDVGSQPSVRKLLEPVKTKLGNLELALKRMHKARTPQPSASRRRSSGGQKKRQPSDASFSEVGSRKDALAYTIPEGGRLDVRPHASVIGSVQSGGSGSRKRLTAMHSVLRAFGVDSHRSRVTAIEWFTAGTLTLTLFGLGFLVVTAATQKPERLLQSKRSATRRQTATASYSTAAMRERSVAAARHIADDKPVLDVRPSIVTVSSATSAPIVGSGKQQREVSRLQWFTNGALTLTLFGVSFLFLRRLTAAKALARVLQKKL